MTRIVGELPKARKNLSMAPLLRSVRSCFEKVIDPVKRKCQYSLTDCLMSGVALFSFKYPSLLQFDQATRGRSNISYNLQQLYNIERVPSDTTFRERLDDVDPKELQAGLDKLIFQAQRDKVIEQYHYMIDEEKAPYLLISLDATGYFNSNEVHCQHCLVKHHKDGSVEYHHQLLAAVIVHPEQSQVLPIMIEPIIQQDGNNKNDCEINAAKRLLVELRKRHPHFKMVIVMDSLYGSEPIITLLEELQFKYIIGTKPSDTKSQYMLDAFAYGSKETLATTSKQATQEIQYANGLPLNSTHHQVLVNYVALKETEVKKIKSRNFGWITNFKLVAKTANPITVGGRSRWKIENETFNTLKNAGYEFEHNFGHGNNNLSTVLAYLMFIAFTIDQLIALSCPQFQAALKHSIRPKYLWEHLRAVLNQFFITSWDVLYWNLAGLLSPPVLIDPTAVLDSS